MQTLRDIQVFQLAAATSSLTAAAHRLDMTPSAASMALKRLEAELGVALFLRSTRSLRLTDEGQTYLDYCQQALRLLADGRDAAQSGTTTLKGILQLSVPSDLGRNVILSWLDEFQLKHSAMQLRLLVSDRPADIYRQPVDLAIRYGNLPNSSLIALPVAPHNHRILCASPDYISRHGSPEKPADLVHHNCLTYFLGDYMHDRWHFFQDGKEFSVEVSGNRTADDGDAVRRWAIAGHGIAYKSSLDVAGDLIAGRLVQICPEWRGEIAPLNLLCANRRIISPVVQELKSFLTEQCATLLNWSVPESMTLRNLKLTPFQMPLG